MAIVRKPKPFSYLGQNLKKKKQILFTIELAILKNYKMFVNNIYEQSASMQSFGLYPQYIKC